MPQFEPSGVQLSSPGDAEFLRQMSRIADAIEKVGESARKTGEEAAKGSKGFNVFETVVRGAIERVGHHITDGLLSIPGKIASGFFALPGMVIGALGSLASGVIDIVGNVTGFIIDRFKDVGQGIFNALSEGVQSNAAFEDFTIRFKVLLGSIGEAKKRMADLAKFGARTPFELPGVVKASLVLQGFGLYSDKAREKFKYTGEQILEIAGDIASGTGQDFAEIASLIGRFASGATGEAISRFQELGIATRETMAEMGLEFAKSGQLLSPIPIAMETVLGMMKEKYGGLMNEQSQTFNGMLSNLMDWKDNTLRTLAEDVFSGLKGHLGTLLERLNSQEMGGAIERIKGLLIGALEYPMQLAGDLLGNLDKLIGIATGQNVTPPDPLGSNIDPARQRQEIAATKDELENLRKKMEEFRIEAGDPTAAQDFAFNIDAMKAKTYELEGQIAQLHGPAQSTIMRTLVNGPSAAESLPPSIRPIGQGLEWLRNIAVPNVMRKIEEFVEFVNGDLSASFGSLIGFLKGERGKYNSETDPLGFVQMAKDIQAFIRTINGIIETLKTIGQYIPDLGAVGPGGIRSRYQPNSGAAPAPGDPLFIGPVDPNASRGRAAGGPVYPGAVYEVGEKRPEYLRVNAPGYVYPTASAASIYHQAWNYQTINYNLAMTTLQSMGNVEMDFNLFRARGAG